MASCELCPVSGGKDQTVIRKVEKLEEPSCTVAYKDVWLSRLTTL